MSRLEARLLGGFQVKFEGREVKTLQAERLILLVSYLLLNSGKPVSRKQLAFLFWADTTEEQARTNLRNLFHHLRKAFPEFDSFIEIEGQSVQWKPGAAIDLDAAAFKSALEGAKAAKDDAARIENLGKAIQLYRGELLPGYYEEWLLSFREEFHQAHLAALGQLAKLLEEARQYEEAVEITNRIIRSEPLNESAYRQAMRLHALNNNRAGALQVYHSCATVLKQELGVEPSLEVRAFYEQLIRSGGESDSAAVRREQAPEGGKLIGRKQEWRQIKEAWGFIQKGKPGVLLLAGEAGIGKTRLAYEMTQWTRRQGICTAVAQCYSAEGDLPFAPVIAWLRTDEIRQGFADLDPVWKKELTRFLPEQAEREDETRGDSKLKRQRLFEALARTLLGAGSPRLLFLDDAHWCDQESLEFIHYLLRYDAHAPLMILATARAEDLVKTNPLQALRLSLGSKGKLTEIELAPLSRHELGQLAFDVTGRELDERAQDKLFTETEGNPLFIVETLRSAENTERLVIPQSLRSILAQRLNQLSAPAHELVGLASVIGREFNYPLLVDVSPLDENTLVQSLDELWSRRIVQTGEADAYHFSHGKLRDAAYEGLTLAKRQQTHRRVAEALSASDGESAVIAGHLEKAGLYQRAVGEFLKAAREARRVFANHNAITHLEKALGILAGKVRTRDESYARLAGGCREMLGDLYDIASDGKRAIESYSESLTQVDESDRLSRARMLGKLGKVVANEGDFDEGKKLFVQAGNVLGEPPPQSDKDWWDTWLKIQFDKVWMHYDWSDIPGLLSTLEEIQPVIETVGDDAQRGEYYFLWPTVFFRRDGYLMTDEIMRYSTLALETSKKTDNMELLTRANFGHGFCHFLLGNFNDAIRHIGEGLQIAEQIGYVEQQIYCLTYLAAAHRGAGNIEECAIFADRACALSERENERSFAATGYANLGWVAWKRGDSKTAADLSRKAASMWKPFYPFQWYGLWTLLAISLSASNLDGAVDCARKLKSPGQQVFQKELDDLLVNALQAADHGDVKNAQALLAAAVDCVKKYHYL